MVEEILEFYHVNHIAHPLADDIAGKCDVSSDTVSQFLQLIDCPDCGDCLVHMEPVCLYLVRGYFQYASKPMDELLIQNIHNIWSGIKALANENRSISSNSIHGRMNSNAIFAFHFSVFPFDSVEERKPFAKTYQSLAAFLHSRMFYWAEKIKSEKPDIKVNDYMGHLGLAARKIVQGSAFESTKVVFDIPPLTRGSIFKATKQSKNIYGKSLLSSGDPTYLKDLLIRDDRNYEKRSGNRRGYQGRTTRWVDFTVAPVKTANSSYPATSGYAGPFIEREHIEERIVCRLFPSPNIPDEAQGIGEYPCDYTDDFSISIPSSWLSSSWEMKRRTEGMIESMVQVLRVQPWDDRCVSFEGLQKVIRAVKSKEGLWRKGVRPIILFSLLAGIPEGALMKTGCMCVPDPKNDEGIDLEEVTDGDSWIDMRKGVIWRLSNRPSMGDDEETYNIGIVEEYRLPPLVTRALLGFPDVMKHVFSKADFRQANQFLEELGLDGLSKISLARLRLSFFAYFVNGAGFPHLYADYLSGAESFYLLSQHSYVTIPIEHLVGEWHRMSDAFLNGVCDRHSVEKTLSDMRYQAVIKFSKLEEVRPDFIGARRTPAVDAINAHLKCLWDKFPHERCELIHSDIRSWNAYVAYLYVFYASCTGQRPLRDPCPRQGVINYKFGAAHVTDKHNRVNKEFRDIPLCISLSNALERHESIQREWMTLMRMKGYSLAGAQDAFLLADPETLILVPVSPRRLDQLLGDGFGSGYFSGLDNGCRHLLLTLLHWIGIPQEWIDYISGHRHAGTEPAHICSPSSSKIIGEQIARIIEEKIVPALDLQLPVGGLISGE